MLSQLKSSKISTIFIQRLRFFTALFLILSLSFSHADTSEEELIAEYQIKAVYLFNFALFFTWPDSLFKYYKQPFHICILGQDPFGIDLDLVIENETIEGRKVTIQRFHALQRSTHCQILFISQSEHYRLGNIFAHLKQYPILSISDIKGFVKLGGMIEFFNTPYNEVRFIVAPETVSEANLLASANLLEIAEIFYRR